MRRYLQMPTPESSETTAEHSGASVPPSSQYHDLLSGVVGKYNTIGNLKSLSAVSYFY